MWPEHLHDVAWQVDDTIDFLEHRDRTQPFFVWYSTNAPHPPFQIHEPYYSMYDGSDIPEPVHGDWSEGERCPIEIDEHRVKYNPRPMRAEEHADRVDGELRNNGRTDRPYDRWRAGNPLGWGGATWL